MMTDETKAALAGGDAGYTGPIAEGMEFIWEKDKPHAWARVVVTRVTEPENDERRIWTKTLQGRGGNVIGEETWNEESRFREAVTLAGGEPLPGGAVSADDTRQFIVTLDSLKAVYRTAKEADIDLVSAMWMNISMDCPGPAEPHSRPETLAQIEERICSCGAGHGSGEGHMGWCDFTDYQALPPRPAEPAQAGVDWEQRAKAAELETCGKCMGSGYGGHPDSGAICPDCNGTGGVSSRAAHTSRRRAEAANLLLDMLYMRNRAHEGLSREEVEKIWKVTHDEDGFQAVVRFLSIIAAAKGGQP